MTTTVTTEPPTVLTTQLKARQYPEPLSLAGVLDQFKYEEVTPVIGREYPGVNLVDDIINAKNSDALIRDLAITISQRGVVFFRAQDNLTDDLQKALVQRLGELSGKPSDSTLHIHPLLNGTHEFGVEDNEISTISSKAFSALSLGQQRDRDDRKGGAASWHSDIQFEQYPADYTSLRLTKLPSSGGDTLWASGYELYDRFSDHYQKFFEGLTATFKGEGFNKIADARPDRFQIYEEPRGNPSNTGRDLTAVHPVVRTNPVTGWKSIFAIGNFPHRINELSTRESKDLLETFYRRIEENHDLQVRFKWRNQNDIAFWDNRSVFHSATNDYDDLGDRLGHRAVGIGEKPYLDPRSQSRTIALRGNR
ncbi:Taurine dioxygenase family protein [Pleurostoma richardsiae]|uniref:Taurine dioxygenase family protein n=1 Tax=Pleurostoma richardsiae TaxID=41990 RepID=A0AA38S7Y9_9PEZI|nr:Taurine dioxygenase family protein [Pleurostoma richardsiae]